MQELSNYIQRFNDAGGVTLNIYNFAAHWLYGTSPESLARMSQTGIVYNPPGH